MNSITRSLNIVAILTKNRDRKQMFLSIKLYIRLTHARSVSRIYNFIDKNICFRSLFFVEIATMFKLLVILFVNKLYARNDNFKDMTWVINGEFFLLNVEFLFFTLLFNFVKKCLCQTVRRRANWEKTDVIRRTTYQFCIFDSFDTCFDILIRRTTVIRRFE